jgi:hypothetical protein
MTHLGAVMIDCPYVIATYTVNRSQTFGMEENICTTSLDDFRAIEMAFDEIAATHRQSSV